MAELAQFRLEGTINEAEQMVRVGLFTLMEVKAITKRRKHFEYKLNRMAKAKKDYLDYITYEIHVLQLLRKRRKGTGYMFKKTELDYAIINRINRLFKFAVYRHQADVNLWFRHIEFLKKMKWKENISRVFMRMLQVHSDKAELWVAAAKWEYEENSSVDTARKLFLRGLRFISQSKLIYQEAFRLELQFMQDSVEANSMVEGTKKVKNEKKKRPDTSGSTEGQIAFIMYKDAVKKIQDPEFQTSFIPICREFSCTKKLEEEIIADIEKRFEDIDSYKKEFAFDFRAKMRVDQGLYQNWSKEELSKVVDRFFGTYKVALDSTPTSEMFEYCINTCLQKSEYERLEAFRDRFFTFALDAFKSANEKKLLSEDMYTKWVSAVPETEKSEIFDFALNNFPQSAKLWLLKIKYEIANKSSEKTIRRYFNRATADVLPEESVPIWHLAIDWVLSTNPSKAVDLLEKSMAIPSQSLSKELKTIYLEFTMMLKHIAAARELYQKLSMAPPIVESFFWRMYQFEFSHPTSSIARLRKILEDIISRFGKSSIDVWLRYVELEKTHRDGRAELISKINWRAVKTLDPSLENKYAAAVTLMQTGLFNNEK